MSSWPPASLTWFQKFKDFLSSTSSMVNYQSPWEACPWERYLFSLASTSSTLLKKWVKNQLKLQIISSLTIGAEGRRFSERIFSFGSKLWVEKNLGSSSPNVPSKEKQLIQKKVYSSSIFNLTKYFWMKSISATSGHLYCDRWPMWWLTSVLAISHLMLITSQRQRRCWTVRETSRHCKVTINICYTMLE